MFSIHSIQGAAALHSPGPAVTQPGGGATEATPARMRSPRGFAGTIVLLSAIPLAFLYQVIFGSGIEVVIHVLFATGFALLAPAVFDFKAPRWLTFVGCASMSAMTVIFGLQAISEAFPANQSLHNLAYDILGQTLESRLGSAFILWCVAMLLTDARGKTKVFGLAVLSVVAVVEIYTYGALILGESPAQILKLLYLPPLLWLLMESRKPALPEGKQAGLNSATV
jgi:hypothetical protein